MCLFLPDFEEVLSLLPDFEEVICLSCRILKKSLAGVFSASFVCVGSPSKGSKSNGICTEMKGEGGGEILYQ